MTEEQLAEALAELAVAAYRGKPPTNVLKALGVIVAMATKGKAVAPSKKRIRATRRNLNGHLDGTATAPE